MPLSVGRQLSSMIITTVNGQQSEVVSALDRGLAFGDGVFETCRVRRGRIPLWDYHSRRLQQGLSKLAISIDMTLIEGYRNQLLELDLRQDSVFKVIVTRGVTERGYGFNGAEKSTVICSLADAPEAVSEPVDLAVCDTKLACSSSLAGLKHLNRLENVLLKAECQTRGCEDGLAVNEQGFVIETTHSNLFFCRDSIWSTPRLNLSGVEGVMRQFLLEELAPAAGIEIAEMDIGRAELLGVESAFCCNSIRGLSQLRSIDGRQLKVDGVDFQRLQQSLNQSRYRV